MISKQGIERFLKRGDIRVLVFDELPSTNTYAVGIAPETSGTTVIVARGQSGGKGTRGRAFFCRPDEGLYLSLILKPEKGLSGIRLITPAAAVAVIRALQNAAGVEAKIKWVNDIVIDDKKMCGILTETRMVPGGQSLEYAVIGVGVNLYVADFPPDIAGLATSLHRHSAGFDANELAAGIINHLCELLEQPDDDAFMDEYRRRSSVLGRRVVFEAGGTPVTGRAVEINHHGNLVVETDDKQRHMMAAGNVSVRVE